MIKIDVDNFHLLSKKAKNDIFVNHPDDLLELIEPLLSKGRFAHSKSVADVAVRLAEIHHVDKRKAYVAGILHDLTKSLSDEEHINYLKAYDLMKLHSPKPLWHSYSAVYFIKEKLNLYDGDILNAIYHHTDGLSKSKLAMIIYIADKREPLRKIEDNILDLAYRDLYKAFKELKIDVARYVHDKQKTN